MRKRFLALLMVAGMAASTLMGCSGSTSSTELSDAQETNLEDGVIALTVWADEATFDTVNQMIDSFKQEYSGQAEFEITLEANSDDETREHVLTDIHNAADVFQFADDQISSLVAGGALYAVPNADEIKSENLEGACSAATVNDIMYAYPVTADNGYFMYYNKKYFSDSDVETLDGMLAVAEENGKKITMDWSSGWYLYAFFGNTGLEFGINDDNVTNYCDWNSTSGDIKGVDIAQAMITIAKSSGFQSGGDDALKSGAADGSVIAGVSGVWCENELKKSWGDDLGAVKLPTYTVAGQQVQMSSFTGYKLMGVNAYSEHPQWAAKLAEWMTNEENQTLRFTEQAQGPSNTKASESEEVQSDPAILAVAEQSEFGTLQRVGNSYWDACTTFGNTLADGNSSGKSLQLIMDDLVAGITKSVAE
jgi:arabinogalactan oligomer/maltooligosaccharide transport system substrate-binding protein